MATLSQSDQLSVLEAAKRDGVSEDSRRIIEIMAETNEILRDAVIWEANEGTKNKTVQRTAVVHGTHRKLYEGVKPTASQTQEIIDVSCHLTAYSEIDAKLVSNQVNSGQFLSDECAAFLEGFAQDQADDLIYGNNSTDERYINGMAVRRAKLEDKICVSAGGSGDGLTSIYLVKWARNKAGLFYPRGAKNIGVNRTDKGIVTVSKDDGSKFEAYQNYFECEYGFALRHPKALIRIANIPTDITDANLMRTIFEAARNLAPGEGTVSVLANNDVLTKVDMATINKANVNYTSQDPWGKDTLIVRGMRFRQCDAIGTESAVS